MKVYSLKDVQIRLFEMAVVIRDILEKNNIKYMIAYGTLLGAVRHAGFIPWDDDFDFYLFDDEYDAAIACLRNELPADLFVEDEKSEPLFFHGWVRVKDLNTVTKCKYYLQDNCYAHKGLSVDLYRAKFCKKSELYIQKADEYQSYIDRRLKKDLITQEEYDRRQDIISKMRNKISSGSRLIMPNLISDEGFYYDDIFPLKKYKFSGELFYGPSNFAAVLHELYGEYMKFPPEDKRKSHYDEVVSI